MESKITKLVLNKVKTPLHYQCHFL